MKDNMGSKRNTDSMEEKTKKPTDKEILIKPWQLTKYGGWKSQQCLQEGESKNKNGEKHF